MTKPSNSRADAFLSLIVAGVVVLGYSGRASSAELDDVPSRPTRTVNYADLNLDTSTGAMALYSRIRSAARDVCSSYESRDLKIDELHQRCVETAVAMSVAHVNKASVTALHNHADRHVG